MIVKPDGVVRGLVSEVLRRFECKGYRFPAMKMVTPSKDLLKEHYAEHVDKDYYPNIESSMTKGPVMVFVVEGNDVIKSCRKMLGATNPDDADPGTIRSDLAQDRTYNICHASDSPESAEREMKLWFTEDELSQNAMNVYNDH